MLPELKGTLKDARKTLGTANETLSGDSPLQQNLSGTLQELQRMARSLRVFSDYLGTHPGVADPRPQGRPGSQAAGRRATAQLLQRIRKPAMTRTFLFPARAGRAVPRDAGAGRLRLGADALLHADRAGGRCAGRWPRPGVAFELLPVSVPAQDDQPQLVIRQGGQGVALLQSERWIAPLGDEIRGALSADLTPRAGWPRRHRSAASRSRR